MRRLPQIYHYDKHAFCLSVFFGNSLFDFAVFDNKKTANANSSYVNGVMPGFKEIQLFVVDYEYVNKHGRFFKSRKSSIGQPENA